MNAKALVVVAGVLASSAAAGQAVPKNVFEAASTEYFPVRGISVDALSAELRRLSPMVPTGQRVMGEYQGGFRYAPTLSIAGHTCVATVRVDVTSKTVLPKWIDAAAGDSALQRQWRYFVSRLAEHEAGHRAINLTIASDLQTALSTIQAASCPALTAAIHARANEFQARSEREQAAYDAETNHGIKQGAVWPVPKNVILLGRPPR